MHKGHAGLVRPRPSGAKTAVSEPLTEEYIKQAEQDARRFSGAYVGTSGTLAAHVLRIISERRMHLTTIAELEQRNKEMRASIEARQQVASQAASVQLDVSKLPQDVPDEYRQANKLFTFVTASPVDVREPDPVLVSSTLPAAQLDAAWDAIRSRAKAAEPAISSVQCDESVAEVVWQARPAPSVIGVTGVAGSGKSLVASMVPSGMVIQLADPLYAMVAVMLGMDEEQLRTRSVKESPVEWLGKTPRELLQTLGTEWGRAFVGPDVWVTIARRRIEELGPTPLEPVVVADVRFDNEAAAIREMGGQVWRVERPGFVTGGHASEQGVSPDLVDFVIHNDGDVDALRRIVQLACGRQE